MRLRSILLATLSDLPFRYRLFFATYRIRTLEPIPFARPSRPLSASRVALVTTGGLHLPEQSPFDLQIKGGDTSFREIPSDVEVDRLLISQRSEAFDHTGFEKDRNLGFPLDRLREMAQRGEIGSVAPRHLAFMGSVTAPGRLVRETAPAAAELFAADGVDAVLLVPL